MPIALPVVGTLAIFFLVQTAICISVSVPLVPPSNAPVLSPSLLSFSIEQDRWKEWVGTSSRNEFLFNTLENLSLLTGEPPRIRIGANSEDRTVYDTNYAEATFPPPSTTVPYPEALNITTGDLFYATAQFLPPNTRVIWGLNLGQNNLTTTFLGAKALLKAFSEPNITNAGIRLEAIQMGNEADLFVNNGVRSKGYDEVAYVKEWLAFATNVSFAFNLSTGTYPSIWAGAFATSSRSMIGFSPQAIFKQGILDTLPGSLISTVSQHRYSGSFCTGTTGLLQDLMTKDSIRGNLSVFASDIKAVREKGLEYVLGETNSYACHGAPGVSNTAGAALWLLDYLFYASQIGISRVYFHQGIGYKYNLIQPTTLFRSPVDGTTLTTPLMPHIQPTYYAAIIAAEAIGNANGVRAVELALDHPRLAGYAFYEGGENKLAKVLLINSQAYFGTNGSEIPSRRGYIHVDFKFLTGNSFFTPPQRMKIKRLSIAHANDTSGLNWGGQTYETRDGLVHGELKVEEADVGCGVDLSDTEAILILFQEFGFRTNQGASPYEHCCGTLRSNMVILPVVVLFILL